MIGKITPILLMRLVIPILSQYHEPSMTVISHPNATHHGSLLGLSMAYFNKHLVIGAPKHGVGKLFDYDIIKNTDLKEISSPFGDGNHEDSYWLGAVIKTGSTFLVTCAPRSYKYWYQKYAITRGSCYTIRENTLKEMQDIPQYLIDYYSNYGLDTSGWSVEVDPQDTVLIGSPAVSLGGTVKKYENINFSPSVLENTTRTVNFDFAQLVSSPFRLNDELGVWCNSTSIANVHNMSNAINIVLFLGHSRYSIASGYFVTENEISYAISSTYGDYGEGMLSIMNKFNKEVIRIYGTEVGSSYGAVLCKVQLNGKRSSLLVGAPTFSENSNQYDNGAVYVYVPKTGTKDLTLHRVIMGQKCGGYFGFTVISLGDMDGDQKDEVAIAAPYEDELRGAVYIYSGSSLLTGASWLQRIQPEKYRSFGLSIVSLNNCFENGCSDLAVGAPLSEKVFVFKCNNYITVNLSAVFPNLQIRNNQSFFDFTTCIKVDLPRNHKIITSKIFIKVELMHPDAVLQNKDGTLIFTLDSKEFYCENISVLTPLDGNYDVLIAYKISASLHDVPSSEYSSSRVLLSDRSNLEIQGDLWAANCKNRIGKCLPALHPTLLSNISEPYIVGTDKVTFSLSVRNVGETAYAACVLVVVLGAHLLRNPNTCTRQDGNERLMCKSPRPIHSYDIWELGEIQIDTNSLTSNDDNIKIQYITYNNCNNEDGKQEYERVFPLSYDDTNIVVTGVSNPNDTVNLTPADLRIEKSLEHFYSITNNGSTHWADVRCEVLLDKKKYLNYKVYILKGRTEACMIMEGEANITSICEIGDLEHNQLVNVIIHVEILPNSLDDIIWTQNVTITSKLAILLREKQKVESITTTLVLLSKSVPVWIPVVASLLALFIIFVIILILYKQKYFERKNKKKLKDFKASIRGNNKRNQQEENE